MKNKYLLIVAGLIVVVLFLVIIYRLLISRNTAPSPSPAPTEAPTIMPTAVKKQDHFLPQTFPTGGLKERDDYQRVTRPDLFLANHTPFAAPSFSIATYYKISPAGHWAFAVTLKGGDQVRAKNDVAAWMTSFGLTASQIQLLDLSYN
ncbi:hypothetical protein HY214_02590 [Candidatus Roizmanbacteria bacterium]|nr:hypothetical protein [Candidatus Roizmanbacteria bacterium]